MPDAAAREALRFIEAAPEIKGVELDAVDIWVERKGGFLVAALPDGEFVEGTSRHVLGKLHGLMHWDLTQSHPASPVIHGATTCIGERRLVVMADKGAGKTTLMLALLAAGHVVEGDEHVVIETDELVARPRTLRVKRGSLRLIPQLPQTIVDGPSYEVWDGGHIYAVSPALFGRPWVVRRGRLDAMVFVEANHGGRSVAKPISPDEAFRRLMATVMFQTAPILSQMARVRRLVSEAPAYVLRLGDLAGAEYQLTRIARS